MDTRVVGKPYSSVELNVFIRRVLRGEAVIYRNPHSLGNFIGCLC